MLAALIPHAAWPADTSTTCLLDDAANTELSFEHKHRRRLGFSCSHLCLHTAIPMQSRSSLRRPLCLEQQQTSLAFSSLKKRLTPRCHPFSTLVSPQQALEVPWRRCLQTKHRRDPSRTPHRSCHHRTSAHAHPLQATACLLCACVALASVLSQVRTHPRSLSAGYHRCTCPLTYWNFHSPASKPANQVSSAASRQLQCCCPRQSYHPSLHTTQNSARTCQLHTLHPSTTVTHRSRDHAP
mmetsp:Transcript_2742/g.6002  ORF Transcript_2742/g.6002 Transcript_2742/m.6002 type:complete len:240 (+) Transcript_2742:30-749(+)